MPKRVEKILLTKNVETLQRDRGQHFHCILSTFSFPTKLWLSFAYYFITNVTCLLLFLLLSPSFI